MTSRRNLILLIVLVLFLQLSPYLLAALTAPANWAFGGFLLNPVDGNSYLSKMQEGWSGSWQFSLLYSPESGHGAYLFLFYLALGHLAHGLGLSLLIVFHAARILGSVALCVALWALANEIFARDARLVASLMALAVLGSGIGWVSALPSGVLTADFWVAEAYPFLSMFANPHFPLGLAVLLTLVWINLRPFRWRLGLLSLFLGAFLAILQPFGVVILAGLSVIDGIILWLLERRLRVAKVLWAMGLSGPILLYQWIAIRSDALLAGWDRQNLTPAPQILDFVLSLSPAILLAGVGVYAAVRKKSPGLLLMAGWLFFGILMVYLPFPLQRRFMLGLYVPAAFLAVAGIDAWFGKSKWTPWMSPILLGVSCLTNLLILISVTGAVLTAQSGAPKPEIYIHMSEIAAMQWLRENSPPESVVLASPEMGQFLPAWSGRRVVYGHPFESVDAKAQKLNSERFFAGQMTLGEREKWLLDEHIRYIFYAGRDRGYSGQGPGSGEQIIFNQNGILITRITP